MNMQLPARYAKFIASLLGLLITYLQAYGANWHLVPAILAMVAALGVMGVPNQVTMNWIHIPPQSPPLPPGVIVPPTLPMKGPGA